MFDRLLLYLTLDWVNQERGDRGDVPIDELLCGSQVEASDCPLANSLGHGVMVEADSYRLKRDWRPIPLPLWARLFVRRFDNGRYPWLVMEPEPEPMQAALEPEREPVALAA